MYIDKELFDECFCPCDGMGRVCLNGSKGIPEELEEIARELDGDYYMCSCFSIDFFKGGAMINYMGEHEFHQLFKCDNYEEVMEFYKEHAAESELEATFGREWGN